MSFNGNNMCHNHTAITTLPPLYEDQGATRFALLRAVYYAVHVSSFLRLPTMRACFGSSLKGYVPLQGSCRPTPVAGCRCIVRSIHNNDGKQFQEVPPPPTPPEQSPQPSAPSPLTGFPFTPAQQWTPLSGWFGQPWCRAHWHLPFWLVQWFF